MVMTGHNPRHHVEQVVVHDASDVVYLIRGLIDALASRGPTDAPVQQRREGCSLRVAQGLWWRKVAVALCEL